MSSEHECESSVFPGEQSHCSLCRECLKSQHTHFGQWKGELQQFLLRYTEIPASRVCKACNATSDEDSMVNLLESIFLIG